MRRARATQQDVLRPWLRRTDGARSARCPVVNRFTGTRRIGELLPHGNAVGRAPTLIPRTDASSPAAMGGRRAVSRQFSSPWRPSALDAHIEVSPRVCPQTATLELTRTRAHAEPRSDAISRLGQCFAIQTVSCRVLPHGNMAAAHWHSRGRTREPEASYCDLLESEEVRTSQDAKRFRECHCSRMGLA
jgi:hypothetical protein